MTPINQKRQRLTRKAQESGIPDHMIEGLVEFIVTGRPVGGFLEAVLKNDLFRALGTADNVNRHSLWNYAMFLYNHAPSVCYGNTVRVTNWVEQGGLFLKAINKPT